MTQIECITTIENGDNGPPVWIASQQSLFWVDNKNRQLYQYNDTSGEVTSCELNAPVLSLSPSINHGFIATLKDGIGFYDMAKRRVTYISKPDPFTTNKEAIAGITDNFGNYWSFTHLGKKQSKGNLYQLSSTMDMQQIPGRNWDCTAPPAFSKDGSRLYQSSRSTRYILVTFLDENRQPIETDNLCRISKQDGYPHGLCVDDEDCLWVCHRAAGCISRYNRRGRFMEKIKVSAPGIKYCTFGGENMDTLFLVTAGSEDLTRTRRNVSLSSAILKFKPGVVGIMPYQFAG